MNTEQNNNSNNNMVSNSQPIEMNNGMSNNQVQSGQQSVGSANNQMQYSQQLGTNPQSYSQPNYSQPNYSQSINQPSKKNNGLLIFLAIAVFALVVVCVVLVVVLFNNNKDKNNTTVKNEFETDKKTDIVSSIDNNSDTTIDYSGITFKKNPNYKYQIGDTYLQILNEDDILVLNVLSGGIEQYISKTEDIKASFLNDGKYQVNDVRVVTVSDVKVLSFDLLDVTKNISMLYTVLEFDDLQSFMSIYMKNDEGFNDSDIEKIVELTVHSVVSKENYGLDLLRRIDVSE